MTSLAIVQGDLGGLTHNLTNGGHLIPTPVSLSALLYITGLAGMGLLGRRRLKENTKK